MTNTNQTPNSKLKTLIVTLMCDGSITVTESTMTHALSYARFTITQSYPVKLRVVVQGEYVLAAYYNLGGSKPRCVVSPARGRTRRHFIGNHVTDDMRAAIEKHLAASK